jgi:ABC-type polysaccharide transport system permease subunit
MQQKAKEKRFVITSKPTMLFIPFILVNVNIWISFEHCSIIYFASIIGFDKAYYEAAEVDGASA